MISRLRKAGRCDFRAFREGQTLLAGWRVCKAKNRRRISRRKQLSVLYPFRFAVLAVAHKSRKVFHIPGLVTFEYAELHGNRPINRR